jgi:iron complex outermembrane recepter protein
MKSRIGRTASAISMAFLASGAGTAFAQEAAPETIRPAPADESSPNQTDRVVVTGSRLATGADAPTPVTSVTYEAINLIEIPNIADALIQLPSLRSSVSSAKGGQGLTIGSQLNLRGIGAFRTLVLVDGKRFVTTAPFSAGQSVAVNIDAIPQGLIQQVDTVTGGASAAYGSDAVAGVVNFILDHDFEGIKAEVTYGQTQRNDGLRYGAELDFGGAFDDGRGHVLASMVYDRDEGIQNDPYGYEPARDWQGEQSTLGRETFAGAQVLVENAHFPMFPLNALIVGCRQGTTQRNYTTCPVFGTSFNDAGTATQAYNFGVRNTPASATSGGSTFANGGDGYSPGAQSLLSTPTIRNSIFGRADYDFTDKLNVYVEANYARTKSLSEAGAGTGTFVTSSALGFPISADYAYLPDNLRTQMQANNITQINVQKQFAFNVKQTFESRTNRIVTGATYDFDENWSGDIYYTYGETKSQMTLGNFSNTIAMQNALTAVRNPVTGVVSCATGGSTCVPWNIFGREPLTSATDRYINPTNYYFNENTQQVVEATVTGSLFALPAGDVDVAVGGGYRKEALDESTDALGLAAQRNPFSNNPGALIYINAPAIKGELELFEGFGEAQIPVLAGLPFVDSLDLNFAARYTDYSTSGGVTTWKAGAVWVPFDGLRIRAARSRDIRAANLIELYNPESTGFGAVRDPQKGGASVSIVPITSGNPDLTPEEADTTTVGFVWNPTFFSQFTATVDYFGIEIADAIATISTQRTLDLCTASTQPAYADYASFCSRIVRNASGDLTTIRTPYSNLAALQNRGVDVELAYNEDLDMFGLDGAFSLRAFATYVFENSSATPGVPPIPIDTSPSVGQLQGLITATYSTAGWAFGVQQHFVGPGRYDPSQPRYTGDLASSQWWTDLSVKRSLGDWQVFASMLNLFDTDPPRFPFTNTSSGFGTSNTYDTQGRRFMVGARVNM